MRFFVFLLLSLMSGGAFAGGLDLSQEDVLAGQRLYLKKCRRCHGKAALGGNAPDIQGVILRDVLEATQGFETMPEIKLTPAEANLLAHYLMSLAPDQALTRLNRK